MPGSRAEAFVAQFDSKPEQLWAHTIFGCLTLTMIAAKSVMQKIYTLRVQYQIDDLQRRKINLNKRTEEKELRLETVTDNIDYWQAAPQCTDKLEAEEKDLERAVRRGKKEMCEVKERLAARIARSEELQAQRGHRVRYSPDIAKALS